MSVTHIIIDMADTHAFDEEAIVCCCALEIPESV